MLGPAKLIGVAGPGFVGARDGDVGGNTVPPVQLAAILVLWLRSDVGVGLVGGDLDTWQDLSLFENNIVANNPAQRAVVEPNWRGTGRPIIQGNSSRLRNAGPLGPNPFGAGLFTFVGRWSSGNFDFLRNLGGPPGGIRFYQVGGNMRFEPEGGGFVELPAPEGQDFICFIQYARDGRTVMQLYVDGGGFFVAEGLLGVSTTSEIDLLLGSNDEGGLAEVAFFNQTLTASARRWLFNYYVEAWNF